MAAPGLTQLDIGMGMEKAINNSRCNQASARLTSGAGTSGTARFEHYLRSTTRDLETTIDNSPRTALIQDIVAIQGVLQMINSYGSGINDGFLASVQPIVDLSEALLAMARKHPASALLLNGSVAITRSEPRSDEATASSFSSTQLVGERLADGRLSERLVAYCDTWTGTLSDNYPRDLDELSNLSSSTDSEGSSPLSDDSAATSIPETVDDVKAQGLKASPPPAIRFV